MYLDEMVRKYQGEEPVASLNINIASRSLSSSYFWFCQASFLSLIGFILPHFVNSE